MQVRQATDGTSNPLPEESVAAHLRAIAVLDEVRRVIEDASAAIEAYLRDAGGTGPATVTAAIPATGKPIPPIQPVFKPMRTDPVKRDGIAPYVGLDHAVATLWDSKGNQVVGIHSAEDDGPATTAQWKAPWGSYPRLRRHVEAHAAARLARGEDKQMAMYINMAPCKYFNGCDKNLQALIPEGSVLFVHQVYANGGSQVHMYAGTGEALRSTDGNQS